MKDLNGQFQATKLANDQKIKNIEACLFELLKETKDMKKHLLQYNFQLRMDTADMTPFFPIRNSTDISAFLKRDDEWQQRKKER